MKSEFSDNSAITLREVTSDDWEAYRDFYKGLSSPILYNGYMQTADLDSRETYKKIFNDMAIDDGPTKMLGLWRDGKMIGQFLYFIEDDDDGKPMATVQGLEIADAYKGRGYFKKLTDAVANHMRTELGPDTKILTTIRQDNRASLRIAKFYGMKIVEDGEYAQSFKDQGYYLLEHSKGEPD